MQLRPFQQTLIDKCRASMVSGKRAPLLVSPCGSGKTVMFCYFAKQATGKGKRILILAHREELLQQISDTLKQFDVPHSFIAAGYPYDARHRTHIGSVFSVAKRLGKFHAPDLIVVDESHHSTSHTWCKILDFYPKAYRIGVTASPQRLSGEALGDIFDDLIVGPSVKELTAMGFLSPYRLFIPSTINTDGIHSRGGDFAKNELSAVADKPKITGNAIVEYKKHANHKKAIVFCTSVVHATHVAEQFSAAGYPAMPLDGTLDRETRRRIVGNFRNGNLEILTSCDLVSEGFSVDEIEVAIMLRPTMSLACWIQQSGRALRIHPGKKEAIILDHANNTMTHGLPDEERSWTLEGRQKSNGEYKSPIRICPSCFAAFKPAPACPFCGAIMPLKPRTVETVAGSLQEIDQAQLALKLKWKREQGMTQSFGELVKLGMARNYRRPHAWAAMILKARQAKKLRQVA